MSRRISRRSYSGIRRGPKYSNETSLQTVPSSKTIGDWDNQINMCMIPPSQNQGMRKAKNFTLTLTKTDSDGALTTPIAWALVYCPNSVTPSNINIANWTATNSSPVSFYEPNQNVIMSGVLPANSNASAVFRTRLARNLNSSDTIFLVLTNVLTDAQHTANPCNFSVSASLNYAICY